MEIAYLASGCFWGTEYFMKRLPGVVSTRVGFMGGHVSNPSYVEVKKGDTGHVELAEVCFDPTKTTYEEVLKMFFETHDFEQTDGQGEDIGSQYLSVIFYDSEEQKRVAEKLIQLLTEKQYKVATKLCKASVFWKAEDYHQSYLDNKGQSPACHSYHAIF